jgi:hypothetical protein
MRRRRENFDRINKIYRIGEPEGSRGILEEINMINRMGKRERKPIYVVGGKG